MFKTAYNVSPSIYTNLYYNYTDPDKKEVPKNYTDNKDIIQNQIKTFESNKKKGEKTYVTYNLKKPIINDNLKTDWSLKKAQLIIIFIYILIYWISSCFLYVYPLIH